MFINFPPKITQTVATDITSLSDLNKSDKMMCVVIIINFKRRSEETMLIYIFYCNYVILPLFSTLLRFVFAYELGKLFIVQYGLQLCDAVLTVK